MTRLSQQAVPTFDLKPPVEMRSVTVSCTNGYRCVKGAGMSTSGNPYGELPLTGVAAVALGAVDPCEHHWFAEPTQPVSRKYVAGLVFVQLIFFIALLGPAIIGIVITVQQIVPDDQKTAALGTVAGFGALFAVIGNVLFGRFSDRTTSPLGRRRPWIVGRHHRHDARLPGDGPQGNRDDQRHPARPARDPARRCRRRVVPCQAPTPATSPGSPSSSTAAPGSPDPSS
jgi:hypothetical protein